MPNELEEITRKERGTIKIVKNSFYSLSPEWKKHEDDIKRYLRKPLEEERIEELYDEDDPFEDDE